MRKLISVVFSFLIISLSLSFAFAHPGSLDSNGGHYNRNTGEYHYHHGYPEHQHTNGKCPYDFKDNVTERSYSEKKAKSNDTEGKIFAGIFVLITMFSIYGLPVIFRDHNNKNSKARKHNKQTKNTSETEQPTQKESALKSEEQSRDDVILSNYKREYIYDTMLKEQKNPTYVIGKDMPSGNFVFSTSSEQNKFAFVRIYPADGSEHRDVRIYGNEQTVALADGETIELCNCRITDSPKIIHPQEKPIVYIVGENIEKDVYTICSFPYRDGLIKIYEEGLFVKSVLIDKKKNVKFKDRMELRLYNCDIKR